MASIPGSPARRLAERGYKVVLSGVGGDELFGGYPSFRQIPRLARLGRAVAAIPGARTLLNAPCAWLARRRAQPKFAAIPAWLDSLEGVYFLRRALFLPAELPALMGEEPAREGLARLGGTPPRAIALKFSCLAPQEVGKIVGTPTGFKNPYEN